MFIGRRTKYSGFGKSGVTNERVKDSIDINLDLSMLNNMTSYVISNNMNIKRMQLINLRNLIDIIDKSQYQSDIERTKRINYIYKGIEARINKNLLNSSLIIEYINSGLLEEDKLDPNSVYQLSNAEIEFIDNFVSDTLKYSFIYNDVDRMLDVLTRFKACGYSSRASIVQEIEDIIAEMQVKFRRVKVQSATDIMFSLQDEIYETVISQTYDKLKDPSRYLYTGMQGFNELLGGAFQSERVYMLLGNTGAGKSLTLLNIALQLKKYNKNYKTKDPTKRPCVVLLTMENSVTETIERLFEIAVNKGNMCDYESPQQILELLKTEGELLLSDDSPIDIIIKYKPNKSVDTSYLYSLTEDLEDEGYEVICLIQDHIKRIISSERNPDIRLELGAIVNDFKIFATLKDLVVITNSHLNREGNRVVDEGMRSSKSDLIRQLGRANVGESLLMLDNLDGAYIIGPEYDANGNKFMAFQRIKERFKCTNRKYICQPFVQGSEIKLMEDMDLPVPLFRESMKETPTAEQSYGSIINKRHIYNNIKDLDDEENTITNANVIFNEEECNLFNGKMYFEDLIIDNDDIEDSNNTVQSNLIMPFRFANEIGF